MKNKKEIEKKSKRKKERVHEGGRERGREREIEQTKKGGRKRCKGNRTQNNGIATIIAILIKANRK